MKKLLIILLLCTAFEKISAQESDHLQSLSAPSSPAAFVLGLQPSSVLAPKSYEAFQAAIFSNFLNEQGSAIVPNDFALEFSPYWAIDRGLTIEEYLNANESTQLLRNASFSIASTQNFVLGDSTSSNAIALGFRTSLFVRKKADKQQAFSELSYYQEIERIMAHLGSQIEEYTLMHSSNLSHSETIAFISQELEQLLKNSSNDYNHAQIKTIINELQNNSAALASLTSNQETYSDTLSNLIDEILESEKHYKQLRQTIFGTIEEKQGFYVDIAAATLFSFPSNTFSSHTSPRQAFWITPTYRFKHNTTLDFLRILGVFRFERYDQEYYQLYFPEAEIYENNVDYGLAVAAEFEKFEFQFEAVGRKSNSKIPEGFNNEGFPLYSDRSSSDFQAIGTFNYKLNEQFSLSYSLGERFNQIINRNNTLVSLFSLNMNFSYQNTDNIK